MRVWVDTEWGTWGTDNSLVNITTDRWTDQDWKLFDNGMSDSERCDYALSCDEKEMTPTQWKTINERGKQ